jgi:hypothetical protein
MNRDKSIYQLTNDSINQTMSRTIVTNGLVFLSVLALVLFGGEVLRGFSLALFVDRSPVPTRRSPSRVRSRSGGRTSSERQS